MIDDRDGGGDDVPPRLHVALEWARASGELDVLRESSGDQLATSCERLATTFRDGVVAHGGPAGDATVTAALLAELAEWLRRDGPGPDGLGYLDEAVE